MSYETIEHIDDRVAIAIRSSNYYANFTDNYGKQKMRSLRTRNLKEARRRAREISSNLRDDTHDRIEEVRDSKHITFRQAADDYLDKCTNAEKTIREDTRRLDYICGDLEDQRAYPREPLGNRKIQTIKTKDIRNWMSTERKLRKWKDGTEHQHLNIIKQVLKHATEQNWVARNEASDIKRPQIQDEKIPEALDDEVIKPLFDLLPTHAMYIMTLLLETGLRSGELFNLRWCDIDTTSEDPSLTVVKSKNKKWRKVPLTDAAASLFDHLRAGSVFDTKDSPLRFKYGYSKLTGAQRTEILARMESSECDCLERDHRPAHCGYGGRYKKETVKIEKRMGLLNRLRTVTVTRESERDHLLCENCQELCTVYDITYEHARKMWRNRNKVRRTITWPSDDNDKDRIIPKIDISKTLYRAAADLGIDEFHPHQMRHTWATRLLEEGIGETELMEVGGWTTTTMVRRYAKVRVIKLSPKIRKALASRPTGGPRTNLPDLRVA